MNTHVPGFQSFFSFWHHFVLVKLATSSIRVNTSHVWLSMIKAITVALIPDSPFNPYAAGG